MTVDVAVQATALGLAVLLLLLRLPGALRGQNRAMFAGMVLIILAMGLSLPGFYNVADAWLGGQNLANLVLRLTLYAVFVILGVKTAAAFGALGARRLIIGPVGIAALVLTVGLTVYFFAASDLPESSVGLQAYETQLTVQSYASLGRLYPAYVAACLCGPAIAAAGNPRLRVLRRFGSGFFGAGLALVVIFSFLQEVVYLGIFTALIPFLAAILAISGLLIMWVSRVQQRRRPALNPLAESYRNVS
ncbi:hypothetical protein [Arthrobacter sp.]|uniref:hypothetical protein n=1 Tax=Arthrobacter sp. TaxID=1667 RepID=UPI00289D34E9|nr:hypothetical protein [Arthrobacter sp.]